MNKYKLFLEDESDSHKYELLSSSSIIKIDRFTSNFDNDIELHNYFKLSEDINLNNGKFYIQNNLLKYSLLYSKHLDFINDLDILKYKLLEKSNDFNFLQDFIEYYSNNNDIKYNIKKIKKSLKYIDINSSNMILVSNSIRNGYIKNIIISNDILQKKYIYIENIKNEINKIQVNLQDIFNILIYNNDKINYLNLRNLCLFIENYGVNNINNKKLVKNKRGNNN